MEAFFGLTTLEMDCVIDIERLHVRNMASEVPRLLHRRRRFRIGPISLWLSRCRYSLNANPQLLLRRLRSSFSPRTVRAGQMNFCGCIFHYRTRHPSPGSSGALTLPDAFHESLHSAVGSTRLKQDGDALVALIHDVLFDLSFDPVAVATASLCIKPRLVLTARGHAHCAP
jgi:hypothetical protein